MSVRPTFSDGNTSPRGAEARARLARGRFASAERPPADPEETLVVDDRAGQRPAQVVEAKLSRILQEASLPVSHLQMRGMLRSR